MTLPLRDKQWIGKRAKAVSTLTRFGEVRVFCSGVCKFAVQEFTYDISKPSILKPLLLYKFVLNKSLNLSSGPVGATRLLFSVR